ncbi:MAG TPA: DNA-3-methyladenine glycosylase [Longimicrobiaceae bacterium]|nr:DNA-3-methyladenine glycosylase [Longimicrobiaceae bacterium]
MSPTPSPATRRRDAALPDPEAVAHLRAADPVLRGVIDRVGPFEAAMERDLWWALVDAIASQQLSVKAAATIVGRLHALGEGGAPPGPEQLLDAPDETLRGAGLSRAKTTYVRDLAARWLDGRLRRDEIPGLPDEEVIATLTQVKGIGRWTAEMVLIFCLDRPDVLPVDDLGIRVAAQRWYGLPERPGRDELERIAEPWRPFRTLASRYLWRSLNATPLAGPPG